MSHLKRFNVGNAPRPPPPPPQPQPQPLPAIQPQPTVGTIEAFNDADTDPYAMSYDNYTNNLLPYLNESYGEEEEKNIRRPKASVPIAAASASSSPTAYVAPPLPSPSAFSPKSKKRGSPTLLSSSSSSSPVLPVNFELGTSE